MKKWLISLTALVLVFTSFSMVFADHDNGKGKGHQNKLELGVEVLLNERADLIEGKTSG